MSKLHTDASTYSLDVEEFIAVIKTYPVIWDINCPEYRYKSKKQAAWDEIAKKFIANFVDLPKLEKLDVYRKLHGKWRNIRDSYVRQAKKRENKRGYVYAKLLSFLDNLYYQPTYFTDEEEQEEGSEEDPLLRSRKRLDPDTDTDETSTVQRKKRRKERKKEAMQDEDRSFFESLLPAVRNFNLDQKLEFRTEILKLVKIIRHNNIPNKIKPEPTDGFDL